MIWESAVSMTRITPPRLILLYPHQIYHVQLRHYTRGVPKSIHHSIPTLHKYASRAYKQFSTNKSVGESLFELFEKPSKYHPKTYRFSHGASAISKKGDLPLDDGKFLSVQVGEDSFYVRPDSLGVADGVGGWAQVRGANPALYSRQLLHHISAQLGSFDDYSSLDIEYPITNNNDDLRAILQTSLDIISSDRRLVGSTTALFVILRDDTLHIANLGDCGMMVIRGNEIIFRTEEQQHSFNFPYQLGTGSTDLPKDAQLFKVKIKQGDLVILGTDGFFDNVFDEDIIDIVRQKLLHVSKTDAKAMTLDIPSLRVDPQDITDALVVRAREVAESSSASNSPFQMRAIEEGLYYQGGKLDDITIVAGVVITNEDSPDRR